MQLSENGYKFIESNEGFSATAYPDRDGHSIGFGYFLITDEDKAKYLHATITREEGDHLMQKRVNQVVSALNKCVKVAVAQHEFDALADWTYNVGTGAMSTSTLVKMLNGSNKQAAADQFDNWIYSNHKPVEDLKKRRAKDKKLFLEGVYA